MGNFKAELLMVRYFKVNVHMGTEKSAHFNYLYALLHMFKTT